MRRADSSHRASRRRASFRGAAAGIVSAAAAGLLGAACLAGEPVAERFFFDPPVRLTPFEPVAPAGARPARSASNPELEGDSIRLAGGFEEIPEIDPLSDSSPTKPTAAPAATRTASKLDAKLLLDADDSAPRTAHRCSRGLDVAAAPRTVSSDQTPRLRFSLGGIDVEWRFDLRTQAADAFPEEDAAPEGSAVRAAPVFGRMDDGGCAAGRRTCIIAQGDDAPSEAAQSVLDVMSRLGSVLDRSEMFADADDDADGASPVRRRRLLQALHDLEAQEPIPEPAPIGGVHAETAEPLAVDENEGEEVLDADALWERVLALRAAASELDHVADRLEAAALYGQSDELRGQAQRLRVEARGLAEARRQVERQAVLQPRARSLNGRGF